MLATLSQYARGAEPGFIRIHLRTEEPSNYIYEMGTLEGGAGVILFADLEVLSGAPVSAQYEFAVHDVMGKRIASEKRRLSLDPDAKSTQKEVFRPKQKGPYRFTVTLKSGKQETTASLPFAIISQSKPGLRPESFFALNSTAGDAATLEFLRRVGVRVLRTHWAWQGEAMVTSDSRKISDPILFDYKKLDAKMDARLKHELATLGVIGYADLRWGRSRQAELEAMRRSGKPGDESAKMRDPYGPPRDFGEFIDTTIPIVKRFKQIKYWEFWSDPWIHGDTWWDSADRFRDFQSIYSEAFAHARPDAKLIGGHSASFLNDVIGVESANSLTDSCNHVFSSASEPNLRSGSYFRYIDLGMSVTKRLGLKHCFVAETGDELNDKNELEAARKLVVRHVQAAIAGAYQVALADGSGLTPDRAAFSSAYANMTRMLEDRVVVADLFSDLPTVWGALYASPDLVREKSARPDDAFTARWDTASNSTDKDEGKVAVVWSYLGQTAKMIDPGRMVLEKAGDLQAFDLFGNPIGERRKNTLTIPLDDSPVYVKSLMSIDEIRTVFKSARLELAWPIALRIQSLTAPPDRPQKIVVRIQNHLNQQLEANLKLNVPVGWSLEQSDISVSLQPGEMHDVLFHLMAGIANTANEYDIKAVCEFKERGGGLLSFLGSRKHIEVVQKVQAAYAASGRLNVDGDLSDWSTAVPVVIENRDEGEAAKAEGRARKGRTTSAASSSSIRARLWTRWDEQNFYLAAEVQEPQFNQKATSDPADYEKFWEGDAIQIAFGLRQNEKDAAKSWRRSFHDTDYLYALIGPPSDQPVEDPERSRRAAVVRLATPDTPFRVHYPSNSDPWYGKVSGSQIVVKRDESRKVTIYEAAIPLKEIKQLPPKDDTFRFSFVIHNDEGVGQTRLQWSEYCGVFDYLVNHATFMPTWEGYLPCQTVWGWVR